MYEFAYHHPTSIEEATALYDSADDPLYLSGGMTLIPTLKQRLAAPSDVIDLSRIETLKGVSVSGDTVSIGSFTTHAIVAQSLEILKTLPALSNLAALIGDTQVRNRGTIGGSLANSDPAADYPAAVVALGATLQTQSRTIAGDEFFKHLFETALEPGELITRIDFPIPTRAAYQKFPNPASRYATVGVMIADFGGTIRVGITGAGACAFRANDIEAALNERLDPAVIDAVEISDDDLNSDLHASAEYRAHLVKVMAKRAVADLLAG